MRISLDPSQRRLASLDGSTLRFYDVSGGAPLEVAAQQVTNGRVLVACDACLGVLTGAVSPAGASLRKASVLRFDWDGRELGATPVPEVDRNALSLTSDGARFVVTVWSKCEVTLFDAAGGEPLGGAGDNIPSGASISPDGSRIIAGAADQGSGAILLFDPTAIRDGVMPFEELPAPKKSPGLDDAPYFSVFSRDGKLAAITNQTWGGRGLFVYDVAARKPVWSAAFDVEEEMDTEEWFPEPVAFTSDGGLVLLAAPGAVSAFRAADGAPLGDLRVTNGDGRCGFAVQDSKRRIWVPGPAPVAYAFPEKWSAAPAAPAKERPAARAVKRPAKPAAKKKPAK